MYESFVNPWIQIPNGATGPLSYPVFVRPDSLLLLASRALTRRLLRTAFIYFGKPEACGPCRGQLEVIEPSIKQFSETWRSPIEKRVNRWEKYHFDILWKNTWKHLCTVYIRVVFSEKGEGWNEHAM